MSNSPIENFDKRISVLETKDEQVHKTLDKLEEKIDANTETVLSIKERLDKQNNFMPQIIEQQMSLMSKMDNQTDKCNTHMVSEAKTELKVKIMWGSIVALLSGIVVTLVKNFIS